MCVVCLACHMKSFLMSDIYFLLDYLCAALKIVVQARQQKFKKINVFKKIPHFSQKVLFTAKRKFYETYKGICYTSIHNNYL